MGRLTLKAVRDLFPITRERVYLFCGQMAPLATPVKQAIDEMAELRTGYGYRIMERGFVDLAESRRLFASLIGAKECEIAATQHTSEGVSVTAELIKPPPGSNIVISDIEHHCAAYPWLLRKNAGVELRYVHSRNNRVYTEDIEKVIDKQTYVIQVSHITHSTGSRYDLEAIGDLASVRGCYFIVDAAQSAGALAIDVKRARVDFLACCGYKWLLGPVGTGFLYVREELIEQFPPPHAGWASHVNPRINDIYNLELHKSAAKYQAGGMPNLTGFAALRKGLEIIHDFGIENVESRILELSGYCVRGFKERGLEVLTPEEPEQRAGVVAVRIKDPETARDYLMERDVIIGVHTFNSTLRIDPHFFNTKEELDRLFEVFDEYSSL